MSALVRPDGKISLGFYGDVYVAGLTVPEVKEKIIRRLQKFLIDEVLGIVEIDEATGEPAVDSATNKPIMIDPKESATVFVDVTAYNSKNYYVQGAVLITGKLPVTGMDTVLDAIHYSGGLASSADHQGVVVYRQTKKGEPPQAMHVDIDQITMGDDLSTNYQLLPGIALLCPTSRITRRRRSTPQPSYGNKLRGSDRPRLRISVVNRQTLMNRRISSLTLMAIDIWRDWPNARSAFPTNCSVEPIRSKVECRRTEARPDT